MLASSPVIVGRDAELALLDSALRDARAGVGRSVFLLGEAGIGKSRLAGECAVRGTASGLSILSGRTSTTGATIPLRPLTEALSSYVRSSGLPSAPELEPYRPALGRLSPEWRSPDRRGNTDSLAELSEALLRLLAIVGRDRGCLLVLEDLHDADPETVAVVEYLVDNVADLPLLVVGTTRPDPAAALDLVRAAARRRVAAVVELGPLDSEDVRSIAGGCLGCAATEVPDEVADTLASDSDGNPYVVEELINAMVSSGALHRGANGWRVAGALRSAVPMTIVQSFADRVEHLDPVAQELLLVAAVLGSPFTVPTIRLVTGREHEEVLAFLRTAMVAHFVVPDESAPDRYAFRHALTAEALIASKMPGEYAALAGRAAMAIEQADPTLPDERCQLVARLLLAAGKRDAAARHYAEAGRRALAAGAVDSAAKALALAHDLATDRTEITDPFLTALAETGDLDRAIQVAAAAADDVGVAWSTDRQVAVHTTLAWACLVAGRLADATTQTALAKSLLREPVRSDQAAALDVVKAHVAFFASEGTGNDLGEADRLARSAADIAERTPLPVVACQALMLLSLLARERGFDEADEYLKRMLAVADAHALPIWRVQAMLWLGGNESMRTGTASALTRARDEATRLGSVALLHTADGMLALNAVLRGDHTEATAIVERHLAAAARMRNVGNHLYLVLTSATSAAHRGRRNEMNRDLAMFKRSGGEQSPLAPVALGLCRAVCGLLEEDRVRATAELTDARIWEEQNPRSVYYLAGRYGLHPLLDILAGRAGWPAYESIAAAPPAQLPWNRQFLLFANAVLCGRTGQPARATTLCAEALATARPFPMAGHLGLRLVSEAAMADGWGEPVAWLRQSEEYFHSTDVPEVSRACRTLIRQAGASVPQRRDGRDQIPPALRASGVTVREYEVLTLLVEDLHNGSIARRLFISPRTVEKHVANLIAKTGLADRSALREYAATQLISGPAVKYAAE